MFESVLFLNYNSSFWDIRLMQKAHNEVVRESSRRVQEGMNEGDSYDMENTV